MLLNTRGIRTPLIVSSIVSGLIVFPELASTLNQQVKRFRVE